LPNDVRQAISLTDVLSALKIYLGKPTPVDTPKTLSKLAADFDADGQVTLSDVLKLLKYYLGKENVTQPQWAWIDSQKIGAAEELSSSLGVHDFAESSNVELVGILRGDVDFSWGG
jgi:hypothetical protein